ncbi:hypothetical protein GQ53DRAFT_227650 [Thozetella sp. PMI_491]|nr:hypothetical protein GQ53DRAFT_227650 [Thozetella sp. PMI_491]
MRLPQASSICALVLSLSPCISAQFKYPPPLERPLTDYTSGAVSSSLNFSDGDNMFGAFKTPGSFKSFMLYRCTHTPSSKTIYPSNSSFTSREGALAADGTWEQMPLYEDASDAFGSGANPGNNPIWFHGDFFAPNETTGNLCWFELYPGFEYVDFNRTLGEQVRTTTVDGASDWYFASVPFVVNPRRPSGLTVTWKSDGTERGKPMRDIFSNSSDSTNVTIEFSSGSGGSISINGENGGPTLRPDRIGTLLGSLALLWFLAK